MLQSAVLRAVLLFGCVAIFATDVLAEQLYRWREADGTTTFSPEPPPPGSGISYEVFSGNAPGITRQTAPGTEKQPALLARSARSIAPAVKAGHCEELLKRVRSLERLIMTDVSAQQMDNAVLQMARYQTSFNQSCQGVSRQ